MLWWWMRGKGISVVAAAALNTHCNDDFKVPARKVSFLLGYMDSSLDERKKGVKGVMVSWRR